MKTKFLTKTLQELIISFGGIIMFHKCNKTIAILIFFVFVSLQAVYSQDPLSGNQKLYSPSQTILAGSEIGFPPYSIVNENNQADGFAVELLREALQTMGYTVEFKVDTWANVKYDLEAGTLDVLPLVARTSAREDAFDFTVPYQIMCESILVHEDDTTIKSLTDLKNKRIGVLKGDTSEEYVRSDNIGSEIVIADTFIEVLQLLSKKQIDAVIIERYLALQLMQKHNISNLKLLGPLLIDFNKPFCFAVTEGNKELLTILNEGLSQIITDGTYDKIYNKWFFQIKTPGKHFDRIIVGGSNAYPPYEFLDKNGNPTGFLVDLTRAIAELVGIEVEIVLAPWAQTYSALLNKEVDMVEGLFYSSKRDTLFDFSQPHSIINQVIATRKGEFVELETMEDLKGLEILVTEQGIMHQLAISYGYAEQVIPVANQEESLRLLAEGSGDCGLIGEIPALFYMDKNGWDNISLGARISSTDFNYATLEGSQDILMLFSQGLATVKANGTYREIYSKWFGAYESQINSLTFFDVVKKFAYIIIPLLLLIVVIVFWSWLLKKQVHLKTSDLQQTTERLYAEIIQKELAKKRIKEGEAKFRNYIENSPNGIFVYDEKGNYLEVNAAAEKMTGYSENELLKMNVSDFPTEDEEQQVIQNPQTILREGENSEILRYNREDGSSDYWTLNTVRLTENRFLGFITDITDLKKAEQEIGEEEERLKVTLRSIGDGVITTDTEGKITIINREAEKLTEWTQKEATGKLLTEVFHIIHEHTGELCENPVEKVLQSGTIVELANHTVLISKTGKRYVIADSGAPIRDQQSKIIGIVLVFRDMTEKYRVQEDIQQTTKLEALGVLAGGIAHDFNNLLSGIFGYIQLAKEQAGTGEDPTTYLDEVLNVFERAKALTLQLLTFSQGGMPKRKTMELRKLIEKAVSFALSGSNVKAAYQIPKNLWSCDIDEHQIGQVIDNIVINAQQAMPTGGILTVAAENETLAFNQVLPLDAGQYIHIHIIDHGIGIPANMLDKIFDPFFTTKQKGNGLGLATCYSIISKHDGRITVDSVLGEGTTFHIYLPRSEDDIATDSEKLSSSYTSSGKILIMDDERIVRLVTGKMLEGMGFTVVEASDGKEVIDLLAEIQAGVDSGETENHGFAAAFFDLTIPGGMGGEEAITEIRKIDPDLPVFASSGYSEDDIMANPQAYGFTSSIPKPFRKEELVKLLSTYLK